MPAVSKAQQRFMGADLGRLRAGKATDTGMSESQLEDFAKNPPTAKRRPLPERKGPPPKKKAALSRTNPTPMPDVGAKEPWEH